MTDLTPITALGAATPRTTTFGALTLRENPGLALASLALRRGAVTPAPLGLALPGPGRWAAGRDVDAFWTGSGQWMVSAEGRAEEDFAAVLKAAAPGCSVTEQTDGFVAIEIASDRGGAPIVALMAKLVNLDAAAFGPGNATRTGLEHMSVFVLRRAGDSLTILGMRSLAGSLWHAIARAAQHLGRES